ncbi:MAG: malto-oligosyltrehalose trehalohydrolase [Succinivibrionaceae bacterium]|nr:malto-oligosyltrehalose trehalohydrolase [Ruminobacter sp.]MEE1339217.1 malto-oligosyltrehalose trehalohydrolase [Succinivibrionaceae bacterium]
MAKIGYFKDQDGNGHYRIFAPFCDSLTIELDKTHEKIELQKDSNGYFDSKIKTLPNGTLYWLIKNNKDYLPDPTSKYQPFDVHSASQITEIEKVNNQNWKGIDYKDAIIYELHIGTFTKEGNLKAAKERLSYIRTLGINVIELMPICAFPGDRNWGYDGTYMFALNSSYGNYKDLKDFIEEAHKFGIAVILDVVYNHFGPEGNYSSMLAPFTKSADTPWGAAINFDEEYSEGIREFYLENVKYWIQDVGFDGFRMDAIALIFDKSPKHILTEINELAKTIENNEHRKIIMIGEHLRNESYVTSNDGYKFDSQWVDDLNYAIYSYLTKENFRHYKDFGSIDDITKALNSGFVYDGTKLNSVYQNYMGEDGSKIEPSKMVVHIQNHDQVGNRPNGDRMIATYGIDKALLAISIVFASPYIPMIFMGEEYGDVNPFLFFESFKDPYLIEAVRNGRKREFSFDENFKPKEPHEVETFIESKLNFDLLTNRENKFIFEYYQNLIALKKQKIIGNSDRNKIDIKFNKGLLTIENQKSIVVCNMTETTLEIPEAYKANKVLLKSNINSSNKEIKGFSAEIFLR